MIILWNVFRLWDRGMPESGGFIAPVEGEYMFNVDQIHCYGTPILMYVYIGAGSYGTKPPRNWGGQ